MSAELIDEVQAELAANIGDRRSGKQIRSPSLLTGMIRDAVRLTPLKRSPTS